MALIEKIKGFYGLTFLSLMILKILIIIQIVHVNIATAKSLIDFQPKLKGIVKTIESEDGDIVDCVDIYKQPAFDNPLLKNHILREKPTFSSRYNHQNNQTNFSQSWHKNGECPKGSIPIRRDHEYYPPKNSSFISQITQFNDTNGNYINQHEYALLKVSGGEYLGAYSRTNIWSPHVLNKEFSVAQTWVISGEYENLNTVEAGWMLRGGDGNPKPQFFTYWTRDAYFRTGCYNLKCPGFVQVNPKFTPNDIIYEVSTYNGKQIEVELSIQQDEESKDWWLRRHEETIGYWPAALFTKLGRNGATNVGWGGEIYNMYTTRHHTTTQMGSGHFPREGFGKAAYFRQVGFYDYSTAHFDINYTITKPGCYNLIKMNSTEQDGSHFFFGGPGYSKSCP